MDKDWTARFSGGKPPKWAWFLWIVFWLTPLWVGPWWFRVFSAAVFVATAIALSRVPRE